MKRTLATLTVATMIAGGSLAALAEDRAADPAVKTAPAGSNTSPQAYPADNSGRNQRDANGATATAEDQSNNKADLEITQAVRKAVVADDSLSTNAQNVKIVTSGGVVILRGPVKSEAEKEKIAAKAKSVAGVARVDNQLEIASR